MPIHRNTPADDQNGEVARTEKAVLAHAVALGVVGRDAEILGAVHEGDGRKQHLDRRPRGRELREKSGRPIAAANQANCAPMSNNTGTSTRPVVRRTIGQEPPPQPTPTASRTEIGDTTDLGRQPGRRNGKAAATPEPPLMAATYIRKQQMKRQVQQPPLAVRRLRAAPPQVHEADAVVLAGVVEGRPGEVQRVEDLDPERRHQVADQCGQHQQPGDVDGEELVALDLRAVAVDPVVGRHVVRVVQKNSRTRNVATSSARRWPCRAGNRRNVRPPAMTERSTPGLKRYRRGARSPPWACAATA